MNIQLKSSHLAFIMTFLTGIVVRDKYHLVKEIEEKVKAIWEPETDPLVTVSCSPQDIVEIFEMLTRSPEGLTAAINAEMDELLLPQIQQGAGAEMAQMTEEDKITPDTTPFLYTASRLAIIRENNTTQKEQRIREGYQFMGININ